MLKKLDLYLDQWYIKLTKGRKSDWRKYGKVDKRFLYYTYTGILDHEQLQKPIQHNFDALEEMRMILDVTIRLIARQKIIIEEIDNLLKKSLGQREREELLQTRENTSKLIQEAELEQIDTEKVIDEIKQENMMFASGLFKKIQF